MLEWTLAGGQAPRRNRGWAVCRDGGGFAWRRLTPAETRAQPGLRSGQPLGDDPGACFNP
ncbi:MAG: hypothetical protein HGA45_18355 [Chloroflexales bacterium]|nr:hypothetical protein [Chloroflexales bacterium]